MRASIAIAALAAAMPATAYLRGDVHDGFFTRHLTITCGALAPSIKRTKTPAGPFAVGDTLQLKLTVKGAGGSSKSAKPMDIVFSIDGSGSMVYNDPTNLRLAAADSFLAKMNPAMDKAGVVSWDSAVVVNEPLSSDFTNIKSKIDSIGATDGTDLNVGLYAAIALLDGDASTTASKSIIFLTDGDGNYKTFADNGPAATAKSKGYVIYTVGLGSSVSVANLKDISDSTSGANYEASDPSALGAIFDKIYKAVESSTVPQHMMLTEVVQNYLTVDPASVIPPATSTVVSPTTGQTTIVWDLGAMNSTQSAILAYKVTVNSKATPGVKPVAVNTKSGISFTDMASANCPFLKTPGTNLEIKDRCDTMGYYKIAGNPTPTSMELPPPSTPDVRLTDTNNVAHTITSDDPSIAANLVNGQTCNGDLAWYYNATGAKINVPDHTIYTTQLLFMKATVQDAQVAAYKAMCGETINLQTTCNNGLPTDVICFKAVCPWL